MQAVTIGTTFIKLGDKQKRVNTVIDIYTTTNQAGNVVKTEYLCVHDFCGQKVTELCNKVTIQRGIADEAQTKEVTK